MGKNTFPHSMIFHSPGAPGHANRYQLGQIKLWSIWNWQRFSLAVFSCIFSSSSSRWINYSCLVGGRRQTYHVTYLKMLMEPQFFAAGLGSIGFPTLPILGFVRKKRCSTWGVIMRFTRYYMANSMQMEMTLTIGFGATLLSWTRPSGWFWLVYPLVI